MLSAEELEQRAEALLAEVPDFIWNGERLPVPIDEIADTHVGLLVRDVADLSAAPGAPELPPDQSLSGLLLAGAGEIWVNAAEGREWPTRRRFTIAHELGHWRLHREPGQATLFCRKAAVSEDDESKPKGIPPAEDEANIFAAALLMPRRLMREHYERLRFEDDCHRRMCGRFGVSAKAMGRRMHTAI